MSSSSSMPPPASPIAHRRTRVNPPLSPPCTPEASPCTSRKMSLSKAATFHVPSSPPTEDAPVLSIRHLARRSPTSSHSSLLDLLLEREQGAARSIQDFEQTFSGARGRRRAHYRGESTTPTFRRGSFAASLSSDEGLGSSISSPTEKELTGSFHRALDLDSALGSSVKSESVKETRIKVEGDAFEDDSPDAVDLIQVTDHSNQAPTSGQLSRVTGVDAAIVHSIAPPIQSISRQPQLSHFACQKLAEHIFHPILQEQRFKLFHPLVSRVSHKTNRTIKCLRDLEQSLIFEPLRSPVSRSLYRSFGEFTIQLVLDSYQHLSEVEQRRPADRPYDNGYFLDLVQQVGRLAAQVGAARTRIVQGAESASADEMDYSPEDEVTLEGGLGETGQPAELVRWRGGHGISLRTNEEYEAQPAIKRQRSTESLDADAERSMARRKKNAEPRVTELRCSDRTCDKIFNRKCDLAKHEKTHSRPFKCPEKTCKYHNQGLPTEKERERHVNDKHSTNPLFFHCNYCPFKTKRDSNCKQHMEKKHNWTYERTKSTSKPMKTPQQTPQTPSMSTPGASDDMGTVSAYESESGSNFTPYTASMDDFAEPSHVRPNPYHASLFPPTVINPVYNYGSPDYRLDDSPLDDSSSLGHVGNAHLPTSYHHDADFFNHPLNPGPSHGQAFIGTPVQNLHIGIQYNTAFPEHDYTIGNRSLQPHSRNPSISEISPMITDDDILIPAGQATHATDLAAPHNYDNMTDLPMNDFDLFAAGGDRVHLRSVTDNTTTTDMSSHHDTMDMFGSADQIPYTDSQLGHYLDL